VTRVFVAAPTRALRLALRALLDGPGIEVVGDGPTPEGAPADTDVVLTGDGELSSMMGAPAGSGKGDEVGTRALVVVSDDERPVRALRGLPLRGWAVVPRDASAGELRAAVTAAAQGFGVVPAALAARLVPARAAEPGVGLDEHGEPLTTREREVLELLAQGLSNRRIAERLGISEHTAKFHVAAICGKLGASSRTEAVSRGLRRGLITL
jgi:DNA-binding NarL/FixJ family response regulator